VISPRIMQGVKESWRGRGSGLQPLATLEDCLTICCRIGVLSRELSQYREEHFLGEFAGLSVPRTRMIRADDQGDSFSQP